MSYVPPAMRGRDSAKVVPEISVDPGPPKTTSSHTPYLPPIKGSKTQTKSKVINTSSMVEFPSLGSTESWSVSSQNKPINGGSKGNYASMAKAWAIKDEDERQKKENDELRRIETERQMFMMTRRPRIHENYSHSSYGTSLADEPYIKYDEDKVYEEERGPSTSNITDCP